MIAASIVKQDSQASIWVPQKDYGLASCGASGQFHNEPSRARVLLAVGQRLVLGRQFAKHACNLERLFES